MYKILWIDDEAEGSGKPIIEQAAEYGFEFIPFLTSVDGMKYLRENYQHVDGIVLDANVFFESVDEMASEAGLQNSQIEIAGLESKHGIVFPKAILTGHFDEDQAFKARQARYEVFSKRKKKNELFKYLQSAIEMNPETQLKTYYPAIYNACSEELLGRHVWDEIVPLLKHLKEGVPLIEIHQFNALRLIIDQIFITLKKYGVVPPALFPRDCPKLTMISKFLSGQTIQESDMPYMKLSSPVFGKLMSQQVWLLLSVVQAGSHRRAGDKEEQDIGLDTYRAEVDATDLVKTLTLITTDLIKWLVKFIDANPVKEDNEKLWVKEEKPEAVVGDLVSGIIERVDKYGNAHFKYQQGVASQSVIIYKETVIKHKIIEGDSISTGTVPHGKNPTQRVGVEPITKL